MISNKMTFLLAITGVLIGGCSPQASPQTYLPAPAAAPFSSPATPVVQAAIDDVGRYGENIYDMAKTGDWQQATSDLAWLKEAAGKLPAEVNGNGREQVQLDDTIQALEKAITEKNRERATGEANQITWIGADLAAQFKSPVPIEVTRLDYYGRQLEISSSQKDEARLKATAADMVIAWNALRPPLEAAGGATEAEQFGKLVAQVQAAQSAADFGKLATPVLDEVDNLEKVFTRK
ncbi:MAG TPA: hypothetical protein VE422_29150 [Terriglobia bacterium]|nr:hypothetical protein [Terriglobia bacterium]